MIGGACGACGAGLVDDDDHIRRRPIEKTEPITIRFDKPVVGEELVSESPIGTHFTAKILGETKVGDYDAVLPSIKGTGYVTGKAEWTLDPYDPFPEGFTLSDIWAAQ